MKNPGLQKLHLVITKSNWGGAQRYVFDLATSLHDQYDISVIAGGEGEMVTRLKEAGIRVVSIPFLKRDISFQSDLRTGFFLWKLFRKERPDIVHLNSSKIGGLGSFFARLAGVPKIIFTLHGLALNEKRSFVSKMIIRFLYWITIFFCHRTIAVSDALKEQSKKSFPFLSHKIVVVKNGIAAPEFVSREAARAHLGLKPQEFVIGIVAELHPIKGHEYLVKGFHEYLRKTEVPENNTLAIIGDGSERKHIESLVTSLNLSRNVVLCGHVTQASRYLKAFDIFILSSLSEGLAYVVQEAGQAGLPVIATRVGGLPEMIIDKQTGILVPSKDPEAIADALTILTSDVTLRERVGTQLKQKISTEFSVEKMVSETKANY